MLNIDRLKNRKMVIGKRIIAVLSLILLMILGFLIFQQKNDTKTVIQLPNGFIELKNTDLDYVFWENQISFFNSNNECIFQSSLCNDEFIVKYKGKYFINENVYRNLSN